MPHENHRGSTVLAWAQLVRLPNVFTAVADVAMGVLFVRAVAGPGDLATLGLLMGASALLYAAGVVLNDVFDYPRDLAGRPERPLPSGRVSRRAAAWLGGEALLLGAMLAWLATYFEGSLRPGLVAAVLAGAIVLYDAAAKRTPAGPLVMGACRMLNVLLGMSVAAGAWQGEHWLVAGAVGTYVTGVTWFARNEAGQSSRAQLALATLVMLGGVALLAWLPEWSDRLMRRVARQPDLWRLMMAVLGALTAFRCLPAVLEPRQANVQRAVGNAILSLVVLDAAVCFAARGTGPAVAILLLLVPAMLAARWIRMT
jgi:hypothetical protein